MSTVGTDKLAEFLRSHGMDAWAADDMAGLLRSPAGIDALKGDETIREGILRAEVEAGDRLCVVCSHRFVEHPVPINFGTAICWNGKASTDG